MASFDVDKDGVLGAAEIAAFIDALGITVDDEGGVPLIVEFFTRRAAEADAGLLSPDGHMTVDGMLAFYRKAAAGERKRLDAAIDNLKSLGLGEWVVPGAPFFVLRSLLMLCAEVMPIMI